MEGKLRYSGFDSKLPQGHIDGLWQEMGQWLCPLTMDWVTGLQSLSYAAPRGTLAGGEVVPGGQWGKGCRRHDDPSSPGSALDPGSPPRPPDKGLRLREVWPHTALEPWSRPQIWALGRPPNTRSENGSPRRCRASPDFISHRSPLVPAD